MSHNHSCNCPHANVKFCSHCNLVYCTSCKLEWTLRATWTYSSYPSYYYTNGIGQAGGNTLTSGTAGNLLSNQVIPGPAVSQCSHGA